MSQQFDDKAQTPQTSEAELKLPKVDDQLGTVLTLSGENIKKLRQEYDALEKTGLKRVSQKKFSSPEEAAKAKKYVKDSVEEGRAGLKKVDNLIKKARENHSEDTYSLDPNASEPIVKSVKEVKENLDWRAKMIKAI